MKKETFSSQLKHTIDTGSFDWRKLKQFHKEEIEKLKEKHIKSRNMLIEQKEREREETLKVMDNKNTEIKKLRSKIKILNRYIQKKGK